MSVPLNSYSAILALSAVFSENYMYEKRLENDVDGKLLYVAFNKTPNASVDDPTWFVLKMSYDVNDFLERVQLPDDGIGFLYSYTDRSSYFS